jgi:hypothetical protein
MENQDFYEGMKTDREVDKEHVDSAEHFVRLKTQTASDDPMLAFARGEGPELFEKEAGLPEAVRGDNSPRTYQTTEGVPVVGWDSRKGYNFTALENEGKYHTLVDHHSSGRVGHITTHPETGAIEQSEIHPSHKHMTERFHETARAMHEHLRHAHASGGAVKTAMKKLGYEIKPEDRPDIKKKDFAQPGKEEAGHKGKYPIPDRQHAKSALGFAKMHGDTGALSAVKTKIRQKYPDMLHGGEEKDSCMMKGAEHTGYFVGPYINRKLEKAVERLKKSKKEKDSCMGKSAGAPPIPIPPVKPIVSGTVAKPPSVSSFGSSSLPKMAGIINARNIGSAAGALLLGGSTYLASRPKKEHKGKSEAEVELSGIVRGQKAEGERRAGFVKKMKNRLNEFNHGVAKVFREHPVKGALLNAAGGASLGRFAVKALGG